MKRITFLSFAVLFSTMLFATAPHENPSTSSKVGLKKENHSTFALTYTSEAVTNVHISIVDASGKTIFSEVLKNTEGFMRPYNFSGLNEGIYTLEVADAFGEHTERIDFHSGTIEKSINLKKITGEDGKYLLTVTGEGKEAISVTIYDAFDNLIHSETKITDGNFAQVYNLGKVNREIRFEIDSPYGKAKSIKF